jgi:hypothetical protein
MMGSISLTDLNAEKFSIKSRKATNLADLEKSKPEMAAGEKPMVSDHGDERESAVRPAERGKPKKGK